MTVQEVRAMPGLGVLDELDVLRRIRHEIEIDLLQTMARFLADHGADTVDPHRAMLPGRERAVRLGGEGTPPVAEFAPALAAGRLEISPWAAARLCADVLDLQHRLPLLWASLGRGEAKAQLARHVAARTRHLSAEQAAAVDARVAESADGRLPWGRFTALVEAAIGEVDAENLRRREEDAATEEFARATRSTEHGMRGFYVRAPFPVIARLDATVALLAEALAAQGHPGSEDERRVLAVLILANPEQAVALLRAHRTGSTAVVDVERLLPTVVLYVHLSDQLRGVARVEDVDSPVTVEWVRRWLGPRCRFTVKPVLIPEAQTPVDAWEVPARHREAVHLMSPADVFPYAANTTRGKQIDHTVPYDEHGPPGQSRIGNYGPMTTFHHRLKTHGGWQVAQPFPGIYLWRDPGEATFLVDHTGTRRYWASTTTAYEPTPRRRSALTSCLSTTR